MSEGQKSGSRHDGRTPDQLRPIELQCGFHRLAEGSCLISAGGTVVLCTASVDHKVPKFLEGTDKGWLTAEYQMHPRANPQRRESRDGRGRALGGRTQEIQRLIGRALRAAVDLKALGPRRVSIDCDVLEADGGTRTASITGGFVALALALNTLKQRNQLPPGVLVDQVAAISVGHVADELLLDLCYVEDSSARVDFNLVGTAAGGLIEVQGTAEGRAVERKVMDSLVDLAQQGVSELCEIQRKALAAQGVELAALGLTQ